MMLLIFKRRFRLLCNNIITFALMNYIELPKEACFTPIFSPRTSLSRINTELDKLTTNLAINIDKYILGFFKDAFEQNNNKLTKNQFISQGLKDLRSWQRELKFRNEKIHHCLNRLFQEADSNNKGVITWNEFNSMLIEKGLNLKSLRNQQPGSTSLMRQAHLNGTLSRHGNPIQKMVNVNSKIAVFTEESNQIYFYNADGSAASLKPLQLSQQALTVETSIFKRNKGGKKQIMKKDLVVAEYKNVILDMIYVNDGKYDMLITSSTDFMVRGWDISSNIPVLAKQPENEDEKMQHQFTNEIHTMAWDNVNEILYCCGKTPVIHEWMVKTDSERQLSDVDGHTEMISAMIMMPKLQFLATGGYDGKLILWDTISQSKKFKYQEHTRSISSMAFHEGLILLFTAAYDHSICVWNPYIQSLIHKIIGNINFIQLDIIPDTNLLIALDAESNVKIREINKFSLVSSFSIDRHEHKIQPSCMISTLHPLRYFFGGVSAVAYDYIHIDANVIQDSTILCLKYHNPSFSLYCPAKNHLVGWDLLTGTISTTLRNQTIGQITAFDIFSSTKMSVLGDSEGNLFLRKLENGVLIKKLYKHKTNVIFILVEELNKQKMIFSASYDGEIAIFEKDVHGDFNRTRTMSVKKVSPLAGVTVLCFQHQRNILIIGTNMGQIYFMDVDKSKIISKCETRAGDIETFFYLRQDNILLSFSKKAQIFGLYLPPHIKKFKPSCHLVSDKSSSKISSVSMSKQSKRCYIGFENGDLMCFLFHEEIISNPACQDDGSTQTIRHLWKNNFGESIKNLLLIEHEHTLVAVIGTNNIVLIGCEHGDQIAELNQNYEHIEPSPILYYDEENDSIYIKSHDVSLPVKADNKEEEIRKFFDPSFYLTIAKSFYENINTTSNPNWKFYPNIVNETNKSIERTLSLLQSIRQYEKEPRKLKLVKTESQPTFDVSKAAELPKQWEKQKEDEDILRASKQKSFYNYGNASSSNGFRGSKHLSLNKAEQKKSQFQFAQKNNSPLYKLGAALRSLNEKDNKALRLLEMAEKQYAKSKGTLKLPKISSHKE